MALDDKVLEEVWTARMVDYSGLRVFRCRAYAHICSEERSKLDVKSKQCMFLRYQKEVKNFKFWDLKENKVVINRVVTFDKKTMLLHTQEEEK